MLRQTAALIANYGTEIISKYLEQVNNCGKRSTSEQGMAVAFGKALKYLQKDNYLN